MIRIKINRIFINRMRSKPKKTKLTNTAAAGEGIRSLDSSAAFRALNFELYARTSYPVMIFGVGAMCAITGYFGWMHATRENKQLDHEYDQLYGQGAAEHMRQRKVNKWD